MSNRITIQCKEKAYVLSEGLAAECKNFESGGSIESDASTELVEEFSKKQDLTQLREWTDTFNIYEGTNGMAELVELFLMADKLGMDVEYFERKVAHTLQGLNAEQLRFACTLPDDIKKHEMVQVALHIKKSF